MAEGGEGSNSKITDFFQPRQPAAAQPPIDMDEYVNSLADMAVGCLLTLDFAAKTGFRRLVDFMSPGMW